ncbi:unnamed protein product [Triticum turgidum subsp. durum]|uniref:Uncharacterized protein n=1 Tax=Triticum turgidum subsp. durum TaxID=4567 RepID=A0A9R0X946_TRITD|nr:unnamed protein product [Triticum turgidum subsp. durum]
MPLASRPSTCNWVFLFDAACKSIATGSFIFYASCKWTIDFANGFLVSCHLQVDPRLGTGSSVFIPLASGPLTCNWVFLLDATCKWIFDLQLCLLFFLKTLVSGLTTCNRVSLFFMPLASGPSTCNRVFFFMPLASGPSTSTGFLCFPCHLQVDPRLATRSSFFDATCKWTLDFQPSLLFSCHLQVDPRRATGFSVLMPVASGASRCNQN